MEEIANRVRRETTVENMINIAKKMIKRGELSLEEIANICELPIEKVRELAAEKSDS